VYISLIYTYIFIYICIYISLSTSISTSTSISRSISISISVPVSVSRYIYISIYIDIYVYISILLLPASLIFSARGHGRLHARVGIRWRARTCEFSQVYVWLETTLMSEPNLQCNTLHHHSTPQSCSRLAPRLSRLPPRLSRLSPRNGSNRYWRGLLLIDTAAPGVHSSRRGPHAYPGLEVPAACVALASWRCATVWPSHYRPSSLTSPPSPSAAP